MFASSPLSFTWAVALSLLALPPSVTAAAGHGLDAPLQAHRSLGKRAADNWPIKTGYVAFGDSYGAGMGTGTTTTDKCRVGSNNFADLLMRWTNNPDVDFQRKVCSGDTTEGLDRQINEWANPKKADLATVSIGGNDLGFSDLVWYCVITPNTLRWGSTNRKACLDAQAKARQKLDDQGENGLKAKFKSAYKKILDKSGRDDFHIYATSYVEFFNPDDPDCDKTTFHYEWAQYDPPSDWPMSRIVYLTTDLRGELNDLVRRLNDVIYQAVDETNNDIGRSRVHFVSVNYRFADNHRWCEAGDFHEPAPDRQDTWFFLSAWPDVPIGNAAISCEGALAVICAVEAISVAASEAAERQTVVDSGKIELPNPDSCNSELGSDPDPWDHWKCRAAEAIRDEADGPLAVSLNKANEALAGGDVSAEEIGYWVPTRQIKTFHPRSPGMVAYRDALIESITGLQATEQGICKMDITQIWTCEPSNQNLYARLRIENPSGEVLYQTGNGRSAPGVSIDDESRLHLQEEGMSEELLVVGQHVNDYIQFYYGDNAWTSWTTEGDARCELVGENWPAEGPTNCPSAAVTRQFKCQYPC